MEHCNFPRIAHHRLALLFLHGDVKNMERSHGKTRTHNMSSPQKKKQNWFIRKDNDFHFTLIRSFLPYRALNGRLIPISILMSFR